MTYAITFKRDGIFHSNLAEADSADQVKEYFEAQNQIRSIHRELIAVHVATSDDMKPGKPVVYCNRTAQANPM